MTFLSSYGDTLNVAVIGASGGIGAALIAHLETAPEVARVFALSRKPIAPSTKIYPLQVDIRDETGLAAAVEEIARHGPLQVGVIASGMLHGDGVQPEKAFRDLTFEAMAQVLAVNTIGPALVLKHLLPLLPRRGRCALAALSARVGSIGDNRLGGWHSYRASKAALNMVLRNGAIEAGRRNGEAIVAGLHPGTVDTGLSAPFQARVPEAQLLSPEVSAGKLLNVIDGLAPADSGQCFDYAGKMVVP